MGNVGKEQFISKSRLTKILYLIIGKPYQHLEKINNNDRLVIKLITSWKHPRNHVYTSLSIGQRKSLNVLAAEWERLSSVCKDVFFTARVKQFGALTGQIGWTSDCPLSSENTIQWFIQYYKFVQLLLCWKVYFTPFMLLQLKWSTTASWSDFNVKIEMCFIIANYWLSLFKINSCLIIT